MRKSRKNNFVKPVQALENKGDLVIRKTLQTTQYLMAVQSSLSTFLDQTIGKHCHIIKIDNDQLALAVPNTAIASKLRQFAPSIVKHLNQHGYTIQEIRIKVIASLHTPPPNTIPTESNYRRLALCHQAYRELLEKFPDGPLAETLRRILDGKTTL